MDYGYIEGTTFEGVMPKVAEKVGVTGGSDVVVPMHGINANGADALEVIDLSKAFEEVSGEEGN